jgi:hypothetical protein
VAIPRILDEIAERSASWPHGFWVQVIGIDLFSPKLLSGPVAQSELDDEHGAFHAAFDKRLADVVR